MQIRVLAPRSAALVPWYLSGGVAAANCIAAYQPIGAASLAASYTNLANPGTYDAAPGVAPTWASATGWTFNGFSQYLTTGVVPTATSWSMIVRISNAVVVGDQCAAGSRNGGTGFELWHAGAGGTGRAYVNGAALLVSGVDIATGILAFAGKTAYLNGATDGTIGAGTTLPTGGIWIGATNNLSISAYGLEGNLLALAIYNTTLTALQVAAISAAMAALTG